MNLLLAEMEHRKPDYELICQNLLEILMVKIARRTHLTVEAVLPSKSSRECTKIKHYIDSNYTQEISLDLLSQISHLNKYYLAHVFTSQFGCSPINYLCEVRLHAATDLLIGTDLNITDVAQSSGFSSLSYFAQAFQKRYGMTASAYRKQHK